MYQNWRGRVSQFLIRMGSVLKYLPVLKTRSLARSFIWMMVGWITVGILNGCQLWSPQVGDLEERLTTAPAQAENSASTDNLEVGVENAPAVLSQQTSGSTRVPVNPFLANSPWPVFHRNSYAQASTNFRGLESGDSFDIDTLNTNIGGTSPWSQLSEAYSDGTRVIWGATTTHVFKVLANRDTFELIDSYRIDRNFLSVHWNLLILAGNQVIVPDPGRRKIYKFADENPNDWRSKIVLRDTFDIPDSIPGKSAHINVAYDGWIIFATDAGYIAAVSPDFSQHRSLQLPKRDGEVNFHNAFSLDETGGIYLGTTDRMLRINWRNTEFSLAWDVPYDFRGPGCGNVNRNVAQELVAVIRGDTCTGSGTTPTLMGTGSDDKLVLLADGHSPANRMVAFWRDAIPANWAGLPGYDRRVAAVTPLPYSTPDGAGFTAENSPTAYGYDIAIAQYNGFKPDCDPVKGVQKLRWNPARRSLDVVWATDRVNFNNVPTYSAGSNLVYGTGRRNCVYYFWGLNWETGAVQLEIPLGDSPDYLDQGNQVTISDDRATFFGSSTGIVRIRPN